MDWLFSIVETLEYVMWGPPLLILLLFTAIFLTIRLRAVQFRYFFKAFRYVNPKDYDPEVHKGDISPFQALMTSLASAVGTGSIVGVATALMIGGVGSIFWMWVTSILMMAVKYSEALLAVKYRTVISRGEMAGGPMYYIEKGLGWRKMALLFAFFASIAAIGTGNLVQANAIAESLWGVFSVDPIVTGLILAIITGFVLLRGIKNIGFTSAILVPLMGTFYIIAGLIVLIVHRDRFGDAMELIFRSAFSGQAAFGGFLGATTLEAIQMGVSRSIFTSEAGLGISSIAAAAAKTKTSVRQALLAMTTTIFSTAIICSITALVVVVSPVMGSLDANGNPLNGAALVIASFNSALIGGRYIVAFALILFAYTTIIAWAYYGEKCCEYLLGEKSVPYYRLAYVFLIIPGALFTLDLVWSFANLMNAFMVIPNLIALVVLSPVIWQETKEFLLSEKGGASGEGAP